MFSICVLPASKACHSMNTTRQYTLVSARLFSNHLLLGTTIRKTIHTIIVVVECSVKFCQNNQLASYIFPSHRVLLGVYGDCCSGNLARLKVIRKPRMLFGWRLPFSFDNDAHSWCNALPTHPKFTQTIYLVRISFYFYAAPLCTNGIRCAAKLQYSELLLLLLLYCSNNNFRILRR